MDQWLQTKRLEARVRIQAKEQEFTGMRDQHFGVSVQPMPGRGGHGEGAGCSSLGAGRYLLLPIECETVNRDSRYQRR
jgi:hypothetical protein